MRKLKDLPVEGHNKNITCNPPESKGVYILQKINCTGVVSLTFISLLLIHLSSNFVAEGSTIGYSIACLGTLILIKVINYLSDQVESASLEYHQFKCNRTTMDQLNEISEEIGRKIREHETEVIKLQQEARLLSYKVIDLYENSNMFFKIDKKYKEVYEEQRFHFYSNERLLEGLTLSQKAVFFGKSQLKRQMDNNKNQKVSSNEIKYTESLLRDIYKEMSKLRDKTQSEVDKLYKKSISLIED